VPFFGAFGTASAFDPEAAGRVPQNRVRGVSADRMKMQQVVGLVAVPDRELGRLRDR
jgi:hypothetical protein